MGSYDKEGFYIDTLKTLPERIEGKSYSKKKSFEKFTVSEFVLVVVFAPCLCILLSEMNTVAIG